MSLQIYLPSVKGVLCVVLCINKGDFYSFMFNPLKSKKNKNGFLFLGFIFYISSFASTLQILTCILTFNPFTLFSAALQYKMMHTLLSRSILLFIYLFSMSSVSETSMHIIYHLLLSDNKVFLKTSHNISQNNSTAMWLVLVVVVMMTVGLFLSLVYI